MSARSEGGRRRGRQRIHGGRSGAGCVALAQGTGRLLRSRTDRGVIAVLDSRLATARYAGFLRASLPPFWFTTDPVVVRSSLRALDEAAGGRRKPVAHEQPTLDEATL